jgi:hypothetical protein
MSFYQAAEKLFLHAGLVNLVHLVSLVQPNKPNRPNERKKPAGLALHASRFTVPAHHPAKHPVADNAASGQTQPSHPAPPDVGPAQDRGRRRGLAT